MSPSPPSTPACCCCPHSLAGEAQGRFSQLQQLRTFGNAMCHLSGRISRSQVSPPPPPDVSPTCFRLTPPPPPCPSLSVLFSSPTHPPPSCPSLSVLFSFPTHCPPSCPSLVVLFSSPTHPPPSCPSLAVLFSSPTHFSSLVVCAWRHHVVPRLRAWRPHATHVQGANTLPSM
eukprot:410264-Hanusia_phi.AAC.1